MTIVGTKWVFRNKLDGNGIVSRNKARLVAQGYNQQEGIDYDETYALVARLDSIRILLANICALDFKLFQMDVKSAFLNGLINDEGTGIETVVYDDSDHAGDYVDRNSTNGICTFVGCCLTSWFSMKQTALVISTTEAEYEAPKTSYLEAVKRIFRYIKGTTHLGLWYPKGIDIETVVYPDSDHARDYVDRKSTNGGHRFHAFACLCHMFYYIESSTPYNLVFFILKRMEKTQNKPKELLPYGMLLSRLFKHVVFVFPELAIDNYPSFDHVMHLLTPRYERKTRAGRGKKRSRESNASSSSSTLNHPPSSHPLDDSIYEMMMNLFIPIFPLHLKTSHPRQMMSLESIKTLIMKVITGTPFSPKLLIFKLNKEMLTGKGEEKFCTTVDTLTQREPHSMLTAMFSGRHTVCKDSE
nr:copia protein [Tanacetum cinerariifolium]